MLDFKSTFQWDFLARCCTFGDGICQLFVQQFFGLFAQFKKYKKCHENYVFLYPFSIMTISPQIMIKNLFAWLDRYMLPGC